MPATATPDYYRLLGLDSGATSAEIKRAYHTRAKQAHPDAGGTEQQMRELNRAYETLADPARRASYDLDRRASPAYHPRPASSRPTPREQAPQAQAWAEPAPPRRHYQPSPHSYTTYLKLRRRQARLLALVMLRRSLLSALAVNVIIAFYIRYAGLAAQQLSWALLAAFTPIYAVILSLVFIIDPDIRLDLHDSAHSRSWRGYGRLAVLWVAIALPFLLLAWLWAGYVWPGWVR